MVTQDNYLLSMENITKIYQNGIIANQNIDFSVQKGEIHGLVGENGAGKSTLMKILFGHEQPEKGTIYYKNKIVDIKNPLTALSFGIGMVHQHFMLVPSLTVAENMVFGIEPKRFGFFDYKKAVEISEVVAKKYGLSIDSNMRIKDLNVAQKQRVEILKMLLRNVEILILDEPTAVLTPQETKGLFTQLKEIRDKGFTIIFISHKLDEVMEICDRVTILRDGKSVKTTNISEITKQEISNYMVGRNFTKSSNKTKNIPGDVVLKVRNLNHFDKFGVKVLNNISFDIRKGEILGIAGIEGNGQRQLSEIITGLIDNQSGEVLINEISINGKSINEIRAMKTSHISEDRMTYGAVSNATIEENLISDRFKDNDFNKHGLLNKNNIQKHANTLIKNFEIKCEGSDSLVDSLSGGNIQKVIAAREFSSCPSLLIANQPTRGIDINASEIIRKKIFDLRDIGSAVLLISADITEILEVSDNIVVLCGGKIVAFVSNVDQISENDLGEYMLGLQEQSIEEIMEAIHE